MTPNEKPVGTARRLALDALTEVRRRDAYVSLFLNTAFERRGTSAEDRRLATAIVGGVLRKRRILDWQIDRVSRIPTSKMEPAVVDALRIAVYQLLDLDRVPAHAAVAESVKLVPQRARGFAKAVLENLGRTRGEWPEPSGDEATAGMVASLPDWIVERWSRTYGPEVARAMALALLDEPTAVLRANGECDAVIASLEAEGVVAVPTRWSPRGIRVDHLDRVVRSEVFQSGGCVVQSESSQLVTVLLDPQPGERVLDVCAAPGGKTTDIAARVGAAGAVTAVEQHAGRASLIEANARRLKLSNIRVVVEDATGLSSSEGEFFDRVLVDAPCTALGQLARHPEARWRLTPDDPARLAALQARILAAVARRVRPGGRLVYGVCTITDEETRDVVSEFVKTHADFVPVDAAVALSPAAPRCVRDGVMEFLPDGREREGFFAAAFERRE